jgi:hypothetical protein
MLDEASDSAAIVGQAEVSEADLAQVLARQPGNQRPWLFPVVMVAAVLAYLALTSSAFTRETFLTFVMPATLVAGGSWYLHVAARRAWIKQAFANVGGSTTFRFDDFGFSSESKLRQHRLAWAALARSLETPEAFLIYTTPRTVLVVPNTRRARARSSCTRARRRSSSFRSVRSRTPTWGGCGSSFPNDFRRAATRVGCSCA